MPEVNLSNAVRSNLLSLQNTANLLEKTQNKLSTGLKVNSALDDPSAFFTASSLNSRAGDLSRLLDSTSNGIQTIQAADNGLSAITKTVESLQANVNQARQDASFKSTSYTIDDATIGTAALKTLDFSGGSVGTTPVSVALNSVTVGAATATTLAGAGGDLTAAFTGGTIQVNGTDVAVRGEVAVVAATAPAPAGGSAFNADTDISALNGATVTLTSGGNTSTYTFTNSATGQTAAAITALTANGFTAAADANGLTISRADGADFNIASSTDAVAIAIGQGTGNTAVAVTNGTEAFDATATTLKADFDAAGITGLTTTVNGTHLDLSLASGADLTLTGDDTLLTTIGYATGAGRTSTNGIEVATGAVQTVDQLVAAITADTNLTDKVRATNDNGSLRIENLSLDDLTLTGASATAVDGSTTTNDIGGNTVRRDLSNQFNVLRTELDKLADDSGFNGINLLRGDKLKLNFNESGTSNIEIQAKDSTGAVRAINSTTLSIASSTNTEFGSNDSLDTRREGLNEALSTLRTQASQFGSSLSIVQNRQDFTKNTINTLETGAANLTLADTNLEGANLLALQTRQQLSSTALSLASQADQNVLRLF